MLLGSYTITVLKEDGEDFIELYQKKLSPILGSSDFATEFALLEMTTQIDPSAASFSLQIKFEDEKMYAEFSALDFSPILELLTNEFPQRYAYFHTLLRYI